MRHGFGQFMRACEMASLPTYVVSGGILGKDHHTDIHSNLVDFMRPVLTQFMDIEKPGVKLFGNVMLFDETDHFHCFTTPHLNTLHKEKVNLK